MDNFTAPHSIVHVIIALDEEGWCISLNKKSVRSLPFYSSISYTLGWTEAFGKTHLVFKVTALFDSYLLFLLLTQFGLSLALFTLCFHRTLSAEKQQSDTLTTARMAKWLSQINKEMLPKGTVLPRCSWPARTEYSIVNTCQSEISGG